MISKAISFLTDFLKRELKLTYALDHDVVVASNLTNADGSTVDRVQNRIVLSVINIEQETNMKSNETYKNVAGKTYDEIAPPIHLNIYLLVAANYESGNYLEGLKMLSSVTTIFQTHPSFTKNRNPDMEDPLTKLTLEPMNVPLNELNHIWSTIGVKYMPSLLYKIRTSSIADQKVKKEISAITGLGSHIKSK